MVMLAKRGEGRRGEEKGGEGRRNKHDLKKVRY
jgi:hypothetical protein